MVTHNLPLLTWHNLGFNQIDQGHGVTFEVNASLTKVAKAYTFYLKNKKNEIELNALIRGDSEDTLLREKSYMRHNTYSTTVSHESV